MNTVFPWKYESFSTCSGFFTEERYLWEFLEKKGHIGIFPFCSVYQGHIKVCEMKPTI